MGLVFTLSPSLARTTEPLAGLDAALDAAREQWHARGSRSRIVKDERSRLPERAWDQESGPQRFASMSTPCSRWASQDQGVHRDGAGLLVEDGKRQWESGWLNTFPEFRVAIRTYAQVTIRRHALHRTGRRTRWKFLWHALRHAHSLERLQYASRLRACARPGLQQRSTSRGPR